MMVVVAESYLQHLEEIALEKAVMDDCAPITYRRYVDDSQARFMSEENANKFLETLNSQDDQIQYTMEGESSPGCLPFLDIQIQNNGTGSYTFKIYRKEAITNVQIHPSSSVNPSTVYGVFKGFLARARRICSSDHLDEEIEFLVTMFVENGHDRSRLMDIVNHPSTNRPEQTTEMKSTVRLPWIPKIGPRLRSVFKKHGVKVVFHSGPSLQNILSRHKCKLPCNSRPGVYKLTCGCSSIYVGETKKRIATRAKEHEKDIFDGNWSSSGAAEHSKTCTEQFDWTATETLAVCDRWRSRKIREAIEIRRHRRDNISILNRDSGTILKTSQWDFLLGQSNAHY